MPSRNYTKIEKTIAETGFFSEYLPPCFRLVSSALHHAPPAHCDLIAPYSFTMSRYNRNDARRNIYIPEIGSYITARNYIRQENILKELIEFTEEKDVSFSPILGENDTIMRHEQSYGEEPFSAEDFPSNYIENVAKKIMRSTGARKILKLDISNCFSSFYMHLIPAILLGIDDAEINYNKYLVNSSDGAINSSYHKYRELDAIIRRQNQNRTNGLLAGSLYSKIIAEAFLTRIDIELIDAGLNFSRYVDDYEVYLYDDDDRSVISIFTNILKRHGLSLNYEKTEIVEFPYYISQNLVKLFDSFTNGIEVIETPELMELFNSFAILERNGTKGSLRYLLKTLERKPIVASDTEVFKAYLITILENNERSLTKACSLLIRNRNTMPLTPEERILIENMLQKHIAHGHDLEALWILFLLISTESLQSNDAIIEKAVGCDNELAQIILLRKGLLSDSQITQIASKAKSWILLYELYADGCITEGEFITKLHLDKNLSMYQHLKQGGIHFCTFEDTL
ncbi:MAG: RNA-directed DNA polymerase [Oscillospiraceae bacterium]|jgi:hypothetical protein